jgi:hypothetical protein
MHAIACRVSMRRSREVGQGVERRGQLYSVHVDRDSFCNTGALLQQVIIVDIGTVWQRDFKRSAKPLSDGRGSLFHNCRATDSC